MWSWPGCCTYLLNSLLYFFCLMFLSLFHYKQCIICNVTADLFCYIFYCCRYDLMLECWHMNPCDRPTFKELVMKTESILNKLINYTVLGWLDTFLCFILFLTSLIKKRKYVVRGSTKYYAFISKYNRICLEMIKKNYFILFFYLYT